MLAVASLAVGVVASLAAPSANAGTDEHRTSAAPVTGGVDTTANGNEIGPLNEVKSTLGLLGGLPHV